MQRLTGPNGEIVAYDPAATAVAYLDFAGDGCRCRGCRNYAAAFESKWLERDVLVACETIGIDVSKAIETTMYLVDGSTGLALYSGQFPFVGRLIADSSVQRQSWGFRSPRLQFKAVAKSDLRSLDLAS
ncbi:MAG TPA: hypothetical protein VMD91_00335 [Candidatus Sulfotelmatobacter sp.]|nr:hypothetical protein [Candidatus Sulfotelmatobacter sp.]